MKVGKFLNGAIGIVGYLGKRNGASFGVQVGFQPVEVIILTEAIRTAFVVDDAGMVTPSAFRMTHDVTFVLPRPGRVLAHGIAYPFGTTGGSKRQVVVIATAIEPRALLVVLDRRHLHDVARIRDHVFVEFHHIKVGIAPIHISLSVVVHIHRGVDVVPMFALPHQRLADGVFVGSHGRICHQHTDAMTMNGTIHIPFAVTVNHLDGPCPVVALVPFKVTERGHDSTVLPVHHVGRNIKQPVLHQEALGIVLIV